MELKPHYLVEIGGVADLASGAPLPHWVSDSLNRAPYVVIRRHDKIEGYLPVGIRGTQRGHRFAAWLPCSQTVRIVTPLSLTNPLNWKAVYFRQAPPAIRTLRLITCMMHQTGYRWGPTGSAGFELATGVSSLTDASDLDLMIESPQAMGIRAAADLLLRLESKALVRLDIQLSTPAGSVSLKEFVESDTILVKTAAGPVLRRTQTLW